ncbi:hypothetical protein RRF57_012294 [Xylaria bambusicola]|uniref:Uncharacterized protein n=1 Tax=Xylaria bambusicola TaxID=326684 RepID=A0AAN7UUY9_9PEZI
MTTQGSNSDMADMLLEPMSYVDIRDALLRFLTVLFAHDNVTVILLGSDGSVTINQSEAFLNLKV